jgi:hypothetical protein
VYPSREPLPLVPFAILRVKGLVAADLTQLIAFTGFFSMFFYATLYMQEILHYSPLKAGAAYLPITAGFAVAGGLASQLVTRIGTRPVVVAGCLIAGAGIYYVSRVPLHGSYAGDLLPGFLVMSLGAGSVFVSVTAAALMRVPIGWAEKQFRSLGRRDAHDLALDLLAAYEGSALLASTLRDPGLLSRAGRRLNHWIDTL